MPFTLETLKSELSARLLPTGGRLTSPHFSSLMHHAVASLSTHTALSLPAKFPFNAFFALFSPWWTISKYFFTLTIFLSSQSGKLLGAGTQRQVPQTTVNLTSPLVCRVSPLHRGEWWLWAPWALPSPGYPDKGGQLTSPQVFTEQEV